MPGSAENLSDANFILNTAVAKSLRDFVDETENAADFECAAAAWGQEDAEPIIAASSSTATATPRPGGRG